MNAKEKVVAALDFKTPDTVPIGTYEFWDGFKKRWRAEKNLGSTVEPEDYYGFATRKGTPIESPFYLSQKVISDDDYQTITIDGWGRRVKKVKGGYIYQVLEAPFKDKAMLDKLEFDSPDNEDRYTKCVDYVHRNKDEYYTMVKIGGPYLRSAFMRGEEDWLMDLMLDEGFTRALLERVTDYLIAIGVNAIKKSEVFDTGIMVADDMASNLGPMFSPALFEKYLLPQYSRIVREFKQAGAKKVIFHSDGNITRFLEYLVEAGIDAINPLEPRAMNIVKTREILRGRMAIMGGVCNTVILPSNDRELIKKHILQLKELTMEGGLVPYAHSIADDIPTADFEYALEILNS